MSESKKKSILGQILITAAVALLAGGTSPWWWKELFGHKERAHEYRPEVPGEIDHSKPVPPDNGRPHRPREDDISKGPFVITTSRTMLFHGPSRRSEPIKADLHEGERFRIIEEREEGPQVWFKITNGDITGWVPAMSVILEE